MDSFCVVHISSGAVQQATVDDDDKDNLIKNEFLRTRGNSSMQQTRYVQPLVPRFIPNRVIIQASAYPHPTTFNSSSPNISFFAPVKSY